MITYKFTNAAGVDIEVLTDGQGESTNELFVVEIRGLESADIKGGFKFDVYPYNEVEFELFAAEKNLNLRKYEDSTEVEGSPIYEAVDREVEYTPETAVSAILPVSVTHDTDTFTVPADVVAFTFTDNSINYSAEFDGWAWSIEVVA